MGDFEDVFGAGADSADIIDGYADDYSRASQVDRVNWYGTATKEELETAQEWDDFDKLCKQMKMRGYKFNLTFATYENVMSWEKSTTHPHVRVPFRDTWVAFFVEKPKPSPLAIAQFAPFFEH